MSWLSPARFSARVVVFILENKPYRCTLLRRPMIKRRTHLERAPDWTPTGVKMLFVKKSVNPRRAASYRCIAPRRTCRWTDWRKHLVVMLFSHSRPLVNWAKTDNLSNFPPLRCECNFDIIIIMHERVNNIVMTRLEITDGRFCRNSARSGRAGLRCRIMPRENATEGIVHRFRCSANVSSEGLNQLLKGIS